MTKYATPLLTIVLLVTAGCRYFTKPPAAAPAAPKPAFSTIETNSIKNESMTLKIQMPKRRYTAGQNIHLGIIAINTGQKPLVFRSPTTALYKVTIYRMTSSGWRWINQYPQDVLKVSRTWTLQPGKRIKYNQIIPVMRDWPMDEALRLVVELEGGPDLKCPIIVSATAK
jgi:hypothetical protein